MTKFPYEIYCDTCDFSEYYCKVKCNPGDELLAANCVRKDGTPAIVGERMTCKCPDGTAMKWRERPVI